MRIGGALRDDTYVCSVKEESLGICKKDGQRGRADLWQHGRDEEWVFWGHEDSHLSRGVRYHDT